MPLSWKPLSAPASPRLFTSARRWGGRYYTLLLLLAHEPWRGAQSPPHSTSSCRSKPGAACSLRFLAAAEVRGPGERV